MTEASSELAEYRKTFDTPVSRLINRMWAGHWHLGVFASADEPLYDAQMRANRIMADGAGLKPGCRVAEVACGVGGTARFLARDYGCTVWATNVAEAQIDEAREVTKAEGLSTAVEYSIADFHALPASDASFDCWWCQEALLYAIDKEEVIREGLRVVKPGGALVLTDLVLDRRLPAAERETFVTAMKAPHMSSPEELDATVTGMGLKVADRRDWSEHATPTYAKLLAVLDKLIREHAGAIDSEAVNALVYRIRQQYELARAGHIGWLYYAISR
jgi:sarcosine/dimethylglycine N-methyltransferase